MRVSQFLKVSEEEFCDAEHYGNIKIPTRATKDSAGYDFVSPTDAFIPRHSNYIIKTGIRAKMEPDTVLLILPRSSMGIKKGITLANTCAVIDSDYFNADNEGHIMLCLRNNSETDIYINAGDHIAQGIFLTYGITKDDIADHVRTGGIGSTGA